MNFLGHLLFFLELLQIQMNKKHLSIAIEIHYIRLFQPLFNGQQTTQMVKDTIQMGILIILNHDVLYYDQLYLNYLLLLCFVLQRLLLSDHHLLLRFLINTITTIIKIKITQNVIPIIIRIIIRQNIKNMSGIQVMQMKTLLYYPVIHQIQNENVVNYIVKGTNGKQPKKKQVYNLYLLYYYIILFIICMHIFIYKTKTQ